MAHTQATDMVTTQISGCTAERLETVLFPPSSVSRCLSLAVCLRSLLLVPVCFGCRCNLLSIREQARYSTYHVCSNPARFLASSALAS